MGCGASQHSEQTAVSNARSSSATTAIVPPTSPHSVTSQSRLPFGFNPQLVVEDYSSPGRQNLSSVIEITSPLSASAQSLKDCSPCSLSPTSRHGHLFARAQIGGSPSPGVRSIASWNGALTPLDIGLNDAMSSGSFDDVEALLAFDVDPAVRMVPRASIEKPVTAGALKSSLSAMPALEAYQRTIAVSLADFGRHTPMLAEVLLLTETYARRRYDQNLATVISCCFAAGSSSLIALGLSEGQVIAQIADGLARNANVLTHGSGSESSLEKAMTVKALYHGERIAARKNTAQGTSRRLSLGQMVGKEAEDDRPLSNLYRKGFYHVCRACIPMLCEGTSTIRRFDWHNDISVWKLAYAADGTTPVEVDDDGEVSRYVGWTGGDPSAFVTSTRPHPAMMVSFVLDSSDGQSATSVHPSPTDALLHSQFGPNWVRIAIPTFDDMESSATLSSPEEGDDEITLLRRAGAAFYEEYKVSLERAVDLMVSRGPGKVFAPNDAPSAPVFLGL